MTRTYDIDHEAERLKQLGQVFSNFSDVVYAALDHYIDNLPVVSVTSQAARRLREEMMLMGLER